MKWCNLEDMSLNEAQQRAVTYEGGHLLVIAGPGSGKTRTATHRCAWLIRNGVNPGRILLVTFTNKAADEMRGRMCQLVSKSAVKQMWAATFHSTCAKLLRRLSPTHRDGRTAGFVIFDDGDSESLVRDIMAEQQIDKKKFSPDEVMKFIDHHKCFARTPEMIEPRDPREAVIIKLWGIYEEQLIVSNAFDFSDLLTVVMNAAEGVDNQSKRLQTMFDYLVVDEYQDTNEVQHRLVKALALRANNTVFAVGDPRQAIYGFRGAHYDNILNFQKEFPGAEVITLDHCYRSSKRIVTWCNMLIRDNALMKAGLEVNPEMITGNEVGERIQYCEFRDEHTEPVWICEQIQRRINEGVDPWQLAVLYRVKHLSRGIEEQLVRANVRYEVIGGTPFYKRAAVKDVISYLRLVCNSDSVMALDRAIGVPSRGFGAKTLQRLHRYTTKHGMWEGLKLATDNLKLNKRQQIMLVRFVQLIRETRYRLVQERSPHNRQLKSNRLTIAQVINMLLDESKLREMWQLRIAKKKGKEKQKVESDAAHLDSVISAISAYEDRTDDPSLQGWLEEVALMSEQDELKDKPVVKLMTIHAAKGLEFEHVLILGFDRHILPLSRAVEEGTVDEEERLGYVAASRAMKSLTITWCSCRNIHGEMRPTGQSPLLARVWEESTNADLLENVRDLDVESLTRYRPRAFRRSLTW